MNTKLLKTILGTALMGQVCGLQAGVGLLSAPLNLGERPIPVQLASVDTGGMLADASASDVADQDPPVLNNQSDESSDMDGDQNGDQAQTPQPLRIRRLRRIRQRRRSRHRVSVPLVVSGAVVLALGIGVMIWGLLPNTSASGTATFGGGNYTGLGGNYYDEYNYGTAKNTGGVGEFPVINLTYSTTGGIFAGTGSTGSLVDLLPGQSESWSADTYDIYSPSGAPSEVHVSNAPIWDGSYAMTSSVGVVVGIVGIAAGATLMVLGFTRTQDALDDNGVSLRLLPADASSPNMRLACSKTF